jgi:hypothetical protein
MAKLSALETHKQLHEVLPGEEVVSLTSTKGDEASYKLNHQHRQVLIAGGPEEDCAWKHTNASYDSVMANLGRAPNQGVPVVPAEPIDMESVAPEVPV